MDLQKTGAVDAFALDGALFAFFYFESLIAGIFALPRDHRHFALAALLASRGPFARYQTSKL
jgi:hypothetical protein